MAIQRAKDIKANLCDSCMLHPAECGVSADDLVVGDGIGKDNVIVCPIYYDSFMAIPIPLVK